MAKQFTSKKEIVEKLRKQIENKDYTAIHTLLFIYDKQVEDEKCSESVNHSNGVGFKPQDAKIGSSLATWYRSKGFFTSKQINTVKQIVTKYAGQVVEAKICEGEIRKIKRGEWIWG
jgi:polyribonucleotide nucleotidyltransferase